MGMKIARSAQLLIVFASLVVLGMGTSLSRTTAAYFASDGAGGFATYVPGVTIAAVNAAWMALFPTSIPASTVIIGRCS